MSNTSLMMILIVFILGAAALIYVQSQDEYTVKIYPVREGTAVTSKTRYKLIQCKLLCNPVKCLITNRLKKSSSENILNHKGLKSTDYASRL